MTGAILNAAGIVMLSVMLGKLAGHLARLQKASNALGRHAGALIRDTQPGGADRSYGIHVGRLAGLPAEVVDRAREVLHTLETGHRVAAAPSPADQLALFAPQEDPVLADLRALDVDGLTPRQALEELADLQKRARGER